MFRNVQVYERYLAISQNAHASTRNIPCMFPPMTTKLFRRAPNPGSMRRATARFVKGAMATNFTSPVVKTGNVIIGNKIYQNITFPNCSQCKKPLLHHKINYHKVNLTLSFREARSMTWERFMLRTPGLYTYKDSNSFLKFYHIYVVLNKKNYSLRHIIRTYSKRQFLL